MILKVRHTNELEPYLPRDRFSFAMDMLLNITINATEWILLYLT
jgi:hypothetical protein